MNQHEETAVDRAGSARALADLARNGYGSLGQPFMPVDFEVHHVADRPGHLLKLLTQKDPRMFLETLTAGANGAGLLVGTRVGDGPRYLRPLDRGSNSDPSIHFVASPDGFYFRGSARPNLTLLYDSASRFEGVVVLDEELVSTRMSHGLQIKDLIKEVTYAASQIAGAPLLYLQSPIQRPMEPEVELGNLEVLPPSASVALRFGIALRSPSTELRMRLAAHLRNHCDARGYELWLNDSRPGHRAGNWFPISASAGDNHGGSRKPRSVAGPDPIGWVLPVTFVGPARIGSTDAIIAFLAQFQQIGIVGCAITSLDDLAFVHLQLALSERGLDRKPEFPVQLAVSQRKTPYGRLINILSSLLDEEMDDNKFSAADVFARAGDYQTLAGPLLPYQPAPVERMAGIWFSWQMSRHDRGLETPIGRLADAWSALCGNNDPNIGAVCTPTIDYLICRDFGNSLLRGKGKMSIPHRVMAKMFPIQSDESPASRLCVGLEDAWKVKLDSDLANGANVHAVTVAWREHWLGHWSALISQW